MTHFLAIAFIVLLCITSFTKEWVVFALIIFGQAHFLITYIYLYKGNKINKSWIIKFLLLITPLAGISWYVYKNTEYYPYLIFTTSLVFVIHYYNDIIKLLGKNNLPGKPIATLGVASACLFFFLKKIFPSEHLIAFILCTLISATCFYIYSLNNKRDQHFIYTLFFSITTPLLLSFISSITIYDLLGFIILTHYLHWYFYYYKKLKDKGEELSLYLDMVIITHIFIFSLFFVYFLEPGKGVLFTLFNPAFFYGWTLLHIAITAKKADYSFSST